MFRLPTFSFSRGRSSLDLERGGGALRRDGLLAPADWWVLV